MIINFLQDMDSDIWSRDCSCEPALESFSRLLEWLVGLIKPVITVLITITALLRPQKVHILNAEVAQREAGRDDLWHKLYLQFQAHINVNFLCNFASLQPI